MDTGTERMLAWTEGPVGWMVFNHPARHNAVSLAMWQAIPRIVAAFAADPAVRVIVVTGAGERAFVSGADISEFAAERATAAATRDYDAVAERACQALEESDAPTIAMIRGYCIGGGVDVALRCDLRIAADDARFGIPAARLGLGYALADLQRLTAVVGPAFAREIFFTARQFSAAEASRMGLVHRVVAAGALEAAVRDDAALIARNAPLTIAAAKKCLREAMKDPGQRDRSGCDAAVAACFESADYAEGRAAFVEKRAPVFRGR